MLSRLMEMSLKSEFLIQLLTSSQNQKLIMITQLLHKSKTKYFAAFQNNNNKKTNNLIKKLYRNKSKRFPLWEQKPRK